MTFTTTSFAVVTSMVTPTPMPRQSGVAPRFAIVKVPAAPMMMRPPSITNLARSPVSRKPAASMSGSENSPPAPPIFTPAGDTSRLLTARVSPPRPTGICTTTAAARSVKLSICASLTMSVRPETFRLRLAPPTSRPVNRPRLSRLR